MRIVSILTQILSVVSIPIQGSNRDEGGCCLSCGVGYGISDDPYNKSCERCINNTYSLAGLWTEPQSCQACPLTGSNIEGCR